ncbi:hypothetical protein HanPI659440_Chr12g0462491 [Helianthus annuus]|nr:hypothetical protein HanPI659440_Chr12g0462491 [Helianthus annuus]
MIPLISSSSCSTKSSPHLILLLQHQQQWLHGDQSSSSPSLSGDIYNIKHVVNCGGRGSEQGGWLRRWSMVVLVLMLVERVVVARVWMVLDVGSNSLTGSIPVLRSSRLLEVVDLVLF